MRKLLFLFVVLLALALPGASLAQQQLGLGIGTSESTQMPGILDQIWIAKPGVAEHLWPQIGAAPTEAGDRLIFARRVIGARNGDQPRRMVLKLEIENLEAKDRLAQILGNRLAAFNDQQSSPDIDNPEGLRRLRLSSEQLAAVEQQIFYVELTQVGDTWRGVTPALPEGRWKISTNVVGAVTGARYVNVLFIPWRTGLKKDNIQAGSWEVVYPRGFFDQPAPRQDSIQAEPPRQDPPQPAQPQVDPQLLRASLDMQRGTAEAHAIVVEAGSAATLEYLYNGEVKASYGVNQQRQGFYVFLLKVPKAQEQGSGVRLTNRAGRVVEYTFHQGQLVEKE